jgi:hypothetical protein
MNNKRVYGVFSEKAIAEIVDEEMRLEKLEAKRDVELNRIANGCCPRHGERIHYGMFDSICGACEYESDTGEDTTVLTARLKVEMAKPQPLPETPDDILF